MAKEIKLSLFMAGYGHHIAAWRHPNNPYNAPMNYDFILEQVKRAEIGLFDLVFFADGLYSDENAHPNILVKLEPITLASSLLAHTKNIGIGITASTTYTEPYNIARYFSSMDHISGGRVAWNIVTTVDSNSAYSFGIDSHLEKKVRYERADEHVSACKSLWRSWDMSNLIRDKERGIFVKSSEVKKKIIFGENFNLSTLLNIEAPIHNQPVLIQAGTSKYGIDLAAKHAEIVFLATGNLEEAKKLYKKIKHKAFEYGRSKTDILIMPGITPFVGNTREEAYAKYEYLQSLIPYEQALEIIETYLGGVDLKFINPKEKVENISFPELNTPFHERLLELIKYSKDRKYSFEELCKFVAGTNGHGYFIGTPSELSSRMQTWLDEEAADAFNIMPALFPDGLNDFVDLVVPELQKNSLYKIRYEFKDLRLNLGLENSK